MAIKQQPMMINVVLAPLVALLLMMGALGSAHATCTAINHSNAPVQIQVLSLNSNASVSAGVNINVISVVEAAAQATVTFTLDATASLIRIVNELTSSTSSPLGIFDGSSVRIEASATVATHVDVFLDASVNGVLTTIATLAHDV